MGRSQALHYATFWSAVRRSRSVHIDCQTCGTELAPAARFCQRCGARVSADPRGAGAGWQAGIPWAAGGAAIGVILTLLVLRGSPGGAPVTLDGPAAQIGSGGAGDISQMSPEERATRLFNRVMRLDEEGKADSVAFFLSMALQSYAMLPGQDPDSRYHVGLLELAGDNYAGALAQADSIHQMSPAHLFTFVLRARVARERNDSAALRRAYADFRRHEREERARGRPEYADHASQLDAFSLDAKR
jgi:hypothetical protein